MSEEPVTKDVAKERFRNSRLQWSNQAVHKLRQELNDIALTKCRDITTQFAECARANGFMVAFRCREHNRAMNECLHQYTSEDQFAIYRAKREKEIAAQVAADLAAEKAASSS